VTPVPARQPARAPTPMIVVDRWRYSPPINHDHEMPGFRLSVTQRRQCPKPVTVKCRTGRCLLAVVRDGCDPCGEAASSRRRAIVEIAGAGKPLAWRGRSAHHGWHVPPRRRSLRPGRGRDGGCPGASRVPGRRPTLTLLRSRRPPDTRGGRRPRGGGWPAVLGLGSVCHAPGDSVAMTVALGGPVALDAGLGFAIREGGKTVGAGTVTALLD
jgi:Elongation factor Tu C-terminal domain